MSLAARLHIFLADQDDRCYACNKRLGRNPALVNVGHEDQDVYVGSECFKCIKAAGKKGWQPMQKGKPFGPKLYLLSEPWQEREKRGEKLDDKGNIIPRFPKRKGK